MRILTRDIPCPNLPSDNSIIEQQTAKGEKMENGTELYATLRNYYGSEVIIRHPIARSFYYTEGVEFFAKNAGGGAYWFLDLIALDPKIKKFSESNAFGIVKILVSEERDGKRRCMITVAADSDIPPELTKCISYTDCPQAPTTPFNTDGSWKFYLYLTVIEGKQAVVLMLSSEY